MADRTKVSRGGRGLDMKVFPKFIEGGQGAGDVLRTDIPNQIFQIEDAWGTDPLKAVPLESPGTNQFAGPAAVPKVYRPIGKSQIVGRPGLDDGDTQNVLANHALKTIKPGGRRG